MIIDISSHSRGDRRAARIFLKGDDAEFVTLLTETTSPLLDELRTKLRAAIAEDVQPEGVEL